jgi:hypothetical protein
LSPDPYISFRRTSDTFLPFEWQIADGVQYLPRRKGLGREMGILKIELELALAGTLRLVIISEMGILGLLQYIKNCLKERHVSNYRGKTAAVDTYAW